MKPFKLIGNKLTPSVWTFLFSRNFVLVMFNIRYFWHSFYAAVRSAVKDQPLVFHSQVRSSGYASTPQWVNGLVGCSWWDVEAGFSAPACSSPTLLWLLSSLIRAPAPPQHPGDLRILRQTQSPQPWPRARPPSPAPRPDGPGHSLMQRVPLAPRGLEAGVGWGGAVPRASLRLSTCVSASLGSCFFTWKTAQYQATVQLLPILGSLIL